MDLTELLEIAEQERQARPPAVVRCCVAAGCVSARSEAVLKAMPEAATAAGLADRVRVCGVGCLRLCSQGPLVATVVSGGVVSGERSESSSPLTNLYQQVKQEDAASIVQAANGGTATAQALDPRDPF